MNENYEELLNRAYDSLPKVESKSERFEVPEMIILYQGNKTIVRNFGDICDVLRREPNLVAKFLSRAVAAPYNIDERRVIFNSKVDSKLLKSKLGDFIEKYVKCPVCGRYDTHFESIDRNILMMKCEVCGARSPVRL